MIKKTQLFKSMLIVSLLVTLMACETIKENLAVTIPINNKELVFEVGETMMMVPGKSELPSASYAENVLLDRTFGVNVASEAEKMGYDFDQIIEFVISAASIELVEPLGYDMSQFNNIKLYFDDRTKLVAQADKVEGGKVTIKIVNGNLLDKLKQDELHVIITGDKVPAGKAKLKLISSYKAKIKIFK